MAIRVIKYFGLRKQLFKLIEECTELIWACLKYALTGKGYDNLIEEIADVSLVSDQVIFYFKEGEKLYSTKHYKLERTLKLISKLKEKQKK